MKKWLIILAVVAALGGAGAFAFVKYKGAGNAAAAVPPVKVKLDKIKLTVAATGQVVSNRDVDIKCKASGVVIRMPKHGEIASTAPDPVLAPSTQPLTAMAPVYTEPMLEVSDVVKTGQLLMQLDPLDMQRLRDQAKIQLDISMAKAVCAQETLDISRQTWDTDKARADSALTAAQAADADAHAKADREVALLAKGMAATEDVDTARTAATQADTTLAGCQVKLRELETQKLAIALNAELLKQAQGQVASDQTYLSIADDNLSYTKVYAPMDGVVSNCPVQVGTIIASGVSNVGGGTTVLTISDLSQIFVLASVDESDIGRVAVGQHVNITADAFPGEKFVGKVTRVAPSGVNTSNVVTFQVQIEVLGANKDKLKPAMVAGPGSPQSAPDSPVRRPATLSEVAKFKLQMTANVEIVIAEKAKALVVPSDAIFTQNGDTYVSRANAAGQPQDVKVAVGLNNGTTAEIVTGLAENDLVIVRKNTDSKWNASSQQRPGGPASPFGGASGGGRAR